MNDVPENPEAVAIPTTLSTEGSVTARPGQWYKAVVLAGLLLLPLIWLLARLIWLPYYFGLFFFLVAGLLVGTVCFRLAVSVRPIPTRRLLPPIILLSLASTLVFVLLEYRNFAAGVAGNRGFPMARNAAVAKGESPSVIEREAEEAFKDALLREYHSVGPVGYIRWAVRNGRVNLTIRGDRETVTMEHRGYTWPVRTAVAGILLGLGLWLGLESLRSMVPVRNIIQPGEEAEEVDE